MMYANGRMMVVAGRVLLLCLVPSCLTIVSSVAADEVSGKITNIMGSTNNAFIVGDKVFAASPSNTVGAKLSDLKEGDKVTVTYAHIGDTSGKSSINALTLMKEE
jgi:hypothetical protein